MSDAARRRKILTPERPPAPARAKLFMNGRSQAVRLPAAFRLPGTEVLVRREGDAVILEPLVRKRWPKGYWERLRELTRDLPADFELPEDPVPAPVDLGGEE